MLGRNPQRLIRRACLPRRDSHNFDAYRCLPMLADDLFRLDAVTEFALNAMALHDTWEIGHSIRTAELIEELAFEMELRTADIVLLKYLAKLHDIGKLGISDVILSRRKLSVSDMDTIRGHPFNGAALIKDMNFDERITLGILQHHECWDGSGYPSGLIGTQITLWARMLLVVDTYDAICSERAEHKARTMTETLKIMEREQGVKSDPDIFRVFQKMMTRT